MYVQRWAQNRLLQNLRLSLPLLTRPTPRHRRTLKDWICPCGSTRWTEEAPFCGEPSCRRRWWAVFGWWFVLVPLVWFTLGVTVWAEPTECQPGYTFESRGICVRR